MNYLQMLEKNIALLPIWSTGKNPKVKKGSWDTIGGTRGWVKTKEEAEKWKTTAWALRPSNGGWAVLDIDIKNGKDGIESLKTAFANNPAAAEFLKQITTDAFPAYVRTPSGGYHFYFKYDGEPIKKVCLFVGVEFFHGNGYVLAPGSIKNGKPYVFYGDMDKAPELPAFILDAVKDYKKAKEEAAKFYNKTTDKRAFGFCPSYEWGRIVEKINDGSIPGRNAALFMYAMRAAESVYSYETQQEALDYIYEHAAEMIQQLGEQEAQQALRALIGWKETPETSPFYELSIPDDATKEELKEIEKKKKEIQKKIDSRRTTQETVINAKEKLSAWVFDATTDVYFEKGFHKLSVSASAFAKQFAGVIPMDKIQQIAHAYELVEIVHGTTYCPARPEEVERFVMLDNGRKRYNTYFPPVWPETDSTEGKDAFLALADHIFSSKKEKETVIEMLAWILQNPGEKLLTAVLLVGEQGGTGKTMFLEAFERLVGQKDYEGVTMNSKRLNNKVISENFTGIYDESVLLHIEELKMKDKVDFINEMKDKITSAVSPMRKMRQDAYMVRNYYNFVASTNYEDALFLDTEDDRRWYMATCHTEPLPQSLLDAFKNALETDDQEFYGSIYHHLMNVNTDRVTKNRGKVNKTPAKSIMFEKSSTKIDRKTINEIDDHFAGVILVTAEDIVNNMKLSGIPADEINPSLVEMTLKKQGFTQHPDKREEKRIRFVAKGAKKSGRHRVFIHPSAHEKYAAMSWDEFVACVSEHYSGTVMSEEQHAALGVIGSMINKTDKTKENVVRAEI